LNKALWALWFSLPTIDTMSKWIIAGSWLADNDYGDMFLNFPLHAKLQKYCDIDLTQLFPNIKAGEASAIVARWLRNAMGLRNYPYALVQGALGTKHIALGSCARKPPLCSELRSIITMDYEDATRRKDSFRHFPICGQHGNHSSNQGHSMVVQQ
jgi:hypothetical protein